LSPSTDVSATPKQSFGPVARIILALIGALFLVPIIVTPLPLKEQAIFGAVIFIACVLTNRFKSNLASTFMIVASLAVSTRYLYWRIAHTLQVDWGLGMILGGLLLFAECYAYLVLLLGYLVAAVPFRRQPAPLPADQTQWPTVDVYIPTYNEPLSVVRTTVLAAQAIDWPADKLRVYILDDGRRDEFRIFAGQCGAGYIRREDNKHAKAGNLNNAMKYTDGDLVAIFDCDHVPTRSFLQLTVGWLVEDEKMALVQTPHHFYTPGPFERNMGMFKKKPSEEELFYGLIQAGNDLYDATFFCGSCAIMRRTALDDVKGIATETVTEDAHTSLRLHRAGWSSAYIGIPQAAGLATESLSAHVGQRIRWARGMTQILRTDNPLLGRGLKMTQRLCYFSAMVHFLYGVPRLIFLTAPLYFLFFGVHIFNAAPLMVLAYAMPHLFHAILTNSRLQGPYRASFWAEVYESVLAFYISIPTTIALLNPRAGSFNVTAKGGLVADGYFDKLMARPYLILAGLNLFGLGAGIYMLQTGSHQTDVVAINIVWSVYNLLMLGGALAVAFEAQQRRVAPRVSVRVPGMIRIASGRTVRCETVDVSMAGAAIELGAPIDVAKGDHLTLSLLQDGAERPLPVEVVGTEGDLLRVRFSEMTLPQESWLVQAVFSRADAWLNWREARHDAPGKEFAEIVRHGFGVIARTIMPKKAEDK
jgi:cellulose synthase (UDP-forming)